LGSVPSPTKREGAGVAPAEPRFEPEPGGLVGDKYRIERVVGEGGMGIVVAATHVELEQPVAIKFLLPDAMRSPEAVERFLREAKVAARVKSEHVARVTDVGETTQGGVPFLVMELLEGRDLGALIDAGEPLPVDEACEIALQAAEALAEVHASGIVHRDLKPSNLFVTRRADGSPCVKLLDFGISKLTTHLDDSSIDPALTATATIMGSPSYMSPEQLKSTKEVDARTDVWSLGAVLYEAVTGKRAFRAETMVQVCALIASEEPAAPSSVRPDLPLDLERVILACLDKKAERRATLMDLARVLVEHAPSRARVSLERIEAILGEAPSKRKVEKAEEPPVSPPPADPVRTQSSWDHEKRRRRGGGGPLLLLAVVAAGVFGFGVYTGRIDVRGLRGQVASATSAVGSQIAAIPTAVASATAAIESAIPVPSLTVEPPPSASEAEDEDEPPAPSTSSSSTSAPSPSAYAATTHSGATRKAPHTKHGTKVHKHHPQ
jgi:serine/threonine protein kinase